MSQKCWLKKFYSKCLLLVQRGVLYKSSIDFFFYSSSAKRWTKNDQTDDRDIRTNDWNGQTNDRKVWVDDQNVHMDDWIIHLEG